jgi:hypothetical protein
MEIRIADCPLGAKCEEIKTDKEGGSYIARCPWYVYVRGTDINTGEETDHWGCAIAWTPTLLINTANESRKGVAATESFRNEVVKTQRDRNALDALQAIRLGDVGILPEIEDAANNRQG